MDCYRSMSNVQNHSETVFTYDSASALGFPPENHLTKLFHFCTLLWKAIFSYPFGTMENEYHDFLKSLYLEWSVCIL